MIREVMDVALTQQGYQVLLAGDGASALDLLRRMRIDLVLLDIHMPRFSGLDFLQTLRTLVRSGPPVLMVTADHTAGAVQEALRLGCSGYVVKPFRPEDLIQRVRRALAGDSGPVANSLPI